MSAIAVYTDLRSGLNRLKGWTVYALGDAFTGPAIVVGVPSFTWGGMCPSTSDELLPTGARWLVAMVVNADEQAIATLLTDLPKVAKIIEDTDGVTVVRADPGLFDSGGQALPCYEIELGVDL